MLDISSGAGQAHSLKFPRATAVQAHVLDIQKITGAIPSVSPLRVLKRKMMG